MEVGPSGETLKEMKQVLAIALCLLCSCSAEKRLLRLLERNPDLRDTVVVHDTITAIVEYVRTDTVFRDVPGDTVTLTKDRLTVRYVRMPGDTVYLEGECKGDTVVQVIEREVPVVQPTKTVTEQRIPWWLIAIAVGSMGVAVIALLRR